jgi:four helix bundle protein
MRGFTIATDAIRPMGMHDFRRLDVWHDSIDLTRDVYEATRGFPRAELFGLTSQMRSAAVSISSNIAEGAGRGTSKEFARFLRIAVGSLSELDSQLELSVRLGMAEPQPDLVAEIVALRKRIYRLLNRVSPPGS